MNADVHECTKGGDIGDCAFENHAGFEIANFLDAILEDSGLESGPGIAARLLQLAQNVGYSRQTKRIVDERLWLDLSQNFGVADQSLDVAFGVDAELVASKTVLLSLMQNSLP